MEINPLKFIADHPFVTLGALALIAIILGVFLITDDGKALVSFLVAHPVFAVLFGFATLIGIVIYLMGKRIPNPDDLRLLAEETWEESRKPGKWLARFTGNSDQEFEYFGTAQHPSRGRYFWGHILESGLHKSFITLLDDRKGRTAGDTIRDYSSILTDKELDTAMKKGLSLEDALRAGEQADEYLSMVKAGEQEREEKKDFWASPAEQGKKEEKAI